MIQLPEDPKTAHDKELVAQAKLPDVVSEMEAAVHKKDFKVGDRVYMHSLPGHQVVNLGVNAQPGSVIATPDLALFTIRLSEPVWLLSEKINAQQEIQLSYAYLWSEAEYNDYCKANPV